MEIELKVIIENNEFEVEYNPDDGGFVESVKLVGKFETEGLLVTQRIGGSPADPISLDDAIYAEAAQAYEEHKNEEVMSHHEETYYEESK